MHHQTICLAGKQEEVIQLTKGEIAKATNCDPELIVFHKRSKRVKQPSDTWVC